MQASPSRTEPPRLILAALLAPLIAILAVVLLIAALVAGIGGLAWSEVPQGAASLSVFFLLFGAPGAYLLEGVVGVPAYYWLTATGRFRLSWVVLCATGAGAIAFSIPWAFAFSNWRPLDFLAYVAIGAAGGAVGGVAFWAIAYTTSGGKRAA
jgi:hypothetical protein